MVLAIRCCAQFGASGIQSAANLTAYGFKYCDPANPNNVTNLGLLHDNKVYNPDGKMTVQCGSKLLTEEQFQTTGADKGTTVGVTPSDSVIIGWAKALLLPLSGQHFGQ